MAGIDKIYGTYAQYKELKKWLKKHRPEALKALYPANQWKKTDKFDVYPISNFSRETDQFLIKNCEIQFIRKRLIVQYGKEVVSELL